MDGWFLCIWTRGALFLPRWKAIQRKSLKDIPFCTAKALGRDAKQSVGLMQLPEHRSWDRKRGEIWASLLAACWDPAVYSSALRRSQREVGAYYFPSWYCKESIKGYQTLLNGKEENLGLIYQKLFGHKSSKIISKDSKTKDLKEALAALLNSNNPCRQRDWVLDGDHLAKSFPCIIWFNLYLIPVEIVAFLSLGEL